MFVYVWVGLGFFLSFLTSSYDAINMFFHARSASPHAYIYPFYTRGIYKQGMCFKIVISSCSLRKLKKVLGTFPVLQGLSVRDTLSQNTGSVSSMQRRPSSCVYKEQMSLSLLAHVQV